MTNKITVELEYTIQKGMGTTEVIFYHPDLGGQLHFQCSSEKLAELQLRELNVNKEDSLDPIQQILVSANKLTEGVSQLKATFSRK